jgi:hypothetical protein
VTWSAHRAGHLETHEDPHHESQHTFTAPFRPHAPDNPVTRIASLSAFSELSRHPGRLSWSALHVLSFLVIQKVLRHDSLESHRQFSRRHHPPRRSLPQHPRRPISAGSENTLRHPLPWCTDGTCCIEHHQALVERSPRGLCPRSDRNAHILAHVSAQGEPSGSSGDLVRSSRWAS